MPMSRTVIGHPLQPVAPALVLKEDLAPGLLQDVLLGLDQDGEGAPRAGGALELLVCRANGGAQVVREDLEEELRGEEEGAVKCTQAPLPSVGEAKGEAGGTEAATGVKIRVFNVFVDRPVVLSSCSTWCAEAAGLRPKIFAGEVRRLKEAASAGELSEDQGGPGRWGNGREGLPVILTGQNEVAEWVK